MSGTIKEYKAIVWTKDPAKPGTRATLHARDSDEALRLLKQQFGEEIVCTIWNEEDAREVR